MFAKLKEIIRNSREDGFLARLKEKLDRDCEHCPCSWEERSYEGECEDCGCRLYKDYDCRHKGCLLPDFILRAIAESKQAKIDEDIARQYDGIGEWYETAQKKDRLFHRALHEAMFVDEDKTPVAPFRRGLDGHFYPYAPSDAWALARMDYEEHLEKGMPGNKAFQKAVAERIETDLYYAEGCGVYAPIKIFANSIAAKDRYHALLKEQGLE